MRARLLETGLRWATAPRFRAFRAALDAPAAEQERVRRRLQRTIARSEYGRAHGLTGTEDYETFRDRLPVVDYEELRPWVDRQAARGGCVLASEPAVAYEKTSGSAGPYKLVPYTPTLLRSFSGCFVIWAHDLLARGPALRTGRIFLSLSPPFHDERATPAGVPIGLDDDAAYLTPVVRQIFRRALFVPGALARVRDPHEYRRRLACVLIAETRLEIVSVWSPTYLLALLDFIEAERDALLRDLSRGRIELADARHPLAPSPAARLRLLERDPIPWTRLWPELKLLSCWTDAGSAAFVPALRRRFPDVLLQGKGLLATEAPLTVPLLGVPAPAPLLDEVFFEFERAGGEIRRLHELEEGEEYGVVVTQAGGFARYRMHDVVRVEGRYGRTPTLRFLGRDDQISDQVGEKLNERFVRGALERIFGRDGACSFLIPAGSPGAKPHYLCLSDHASARDRQAECAARLEEELLRAFHYRQARLLEQLGPVELRYGADARRTYEAHYLARGLRWGNIKYSALVTAPAGARR